MRFVYLPLNPEPRLAIPEPQLFVSTTTASGCPALQQHATSCREKENWQYPASFFPLPRLPRLDNAAIPEYREDRIPNTTLQLYVSRSPCPWPADGTVRNAHGEANGNAVCHTQSLAGLNPWPRLFTHIQSTHLLCRVAFFWPPTQGACIWLFPVSIQVDRQRRIKHLIAAFFFYCGRPSPASIARYCGGAKSCTAVASSLVSGCRGRGSGHAHGTWLYIRGQVPGLRGRGGDGEGGAEAGTPMLSGTFGDRAGLMGRSKVCLGFCGSDWV
ncbi:hypothetical protein F5144DRAFT_199092 [Chaetomium tenue]|uniref:Uncharacterized protein n=1 Tax=Chaetomium tenue TaxID=1854479 RepID=A0ACB7PGT3_9PEZI|nr:hypothetical protein F5144DRAFT_199092 [Chaetomium globosum]